MTVLFYIAIEIQCKVFERMLNQAQVYVAKAIT